jgi:hypothetical protein
MDINKHETLLDTNLSKATALLLLFQISVTVGFSIINITHTLK